MIAERVNVNLPDVFSWLVSDLVVLYSGTSGAPCILLLNVTMSALQGRGGLEM